ncbi:MAG: Rrf2 family transcriptional regulator [Gammaproteobacteria bacterium]|nr:Rrf2 family transcriptional regulator [Gammaproteobacteria bacterium]
MQISRFADYGLRILIYLTQTPGRAVPMREIAAFFDISHEHLRKVVHHLSQAGLIHGDRGRLGGLRLAHDPATIRVGAVLDDMDKPAAIVECYGRNPCRLAPGCRLEGALEEARGTFMERLNRYTLADMVATPAMRRKFDTLGDALVDALGEAAVPPVGEAP